MAQHPALQDWLSGRAERDLAETLVALADAASQLAARIAEGPLGGESLEGAVGENADGDQQKMLDVFADRAFHAAIDDSAVRWFVSEEQDAAQALNPDGALALAIDPLDGSSNIATNVSIGTVFSIFPAEETAEASFLRPGREQSAAGYVIYGPQCRLLLTLGDGVIAFIRDHEGVFRLVNEHLTVAREAREFAINASNHRHWPAPIRAYVEDCLAGVEGPRGKNFNMRWVASLVAETHRIMSRGGVFLYPGDDRPGYEKGRLRHCYECAPIAMLVEQAGGGATNGTEAILDLIPEGFHARTPFVFGSADKVARITAYHDLPPGETSPLFARRGLFSA